MPYVAVDEAKQALLPESVEPDDEGAAERPAHRAAAPLMPPRHAIKSFDFVLYADQRNLLVEVKGRKVARRRARPTAGPAHASPSTRRAVAAPRPLASGRLENWVTHTDIQSLAAWQALFGEGFSGAFVFVYWCEEQPPDGLFQEVFVFEGRWYALRAVPLDDYARWMKPRSPRWGTVDLSRRDFERVSSTFSWSFLGGQG